MFPGLIVRDVEDSDIWTRTREGEVLLPTPEHSLFADWVPERDDAELPVKTGKVLESLRSVYLIPYQGQQLLSSQNDATGNPAVTQDDDDDVPMPGLSLQLSSFVSSPSVIVRSVSFSL